MGLPSIDAILALEQPFRAQIKQVGVDGFGSLIPCFVIDLVIESKPFEMSGNNFLIKSSLRGSYRMNHLDEKFPELAEAANRENFDVIDGLLDVDGNYFAFNKAEYLDFVQGNHFVHIARNTPNSLIFKANDVEMSEETKKLATEKMRAFLKALDVQIRSGEFKEGKRFIELIKH